MPIGLAADASKPVLDAEKRRDAVRQPVGAECEPQVEIHEQPSCQVGLEPDRRARRPERLVEDRDVVKVAVRVSPTAVNVSMRTRGELIARRPSKSVVRLNLSVTPMSAPKAYSN